MIEIPLTVADFSPAPAPIVVACSLGGLGFLTLPPENKLTWLAIDGSGCAAEPPEKFHVDCKPGCGDGRAAAPGRGAAGAGVR